MFTKVLLTVDLSHEASWKKALPVAADLATQGSGELHLLTIVPEIGSVLVVQDLGEGFVKKAMADALADLKALRKTAANWPPEVREHVRYGTVHSEIVAAIDELGADLVVMASHAPDRIREFLVGSQADRVVRRSPVSVLVVR
ncbi:universal stress protein [Pseudotabrizicola sp. L79]|uniref:universal stress protein n=1 Tax=Pseudotabrizicola sp. L79 TaxID=3118402 RepID=UPI002F92DA4A